ncbi:MAG: glycosyltransferase family 39 protein [Terriglobia bacterium]|jgi:hypothetical protein
MQRYYELLAGLALFVMLPLFILAILTYWLSAGWLDHAEPTVVAIAWLFRKGHALYQTVDAAPRYSMVYGPASFLAIAASLWLFGGSVHAAKLPGVICPLVSLVLLRLSLGRSTSRNASFTAIFYFCAACLLFNNYAFFPRPDSFLVLCSAVGLFACTLENLWVAPLLCGLALGAGFNLKATAIAYFLPYLGFLYQRNRVQALARTFVASAVTAVLPFALFRRISLLNYFECLRNSAREGLDWRDGIRTLEIGGFYVLPLVVLMACWFASSREDWRCALNRNKFFVGGSVLASLLILVVASKPGAGPHHLLPFIPLVAFLLGKLETSHRVQAMWDRGMPRLAWSALVSFTLALLLYGACGARLVIEGSLSRNYEAKSVVDDLKNLEQRYPHCDILMGYGDTNITTSVSYPLTFNRTELVFRNQPYLVDAPALMDMQEGGLPMPAATLEALRSGRRSLWLIPRGEVPFKDVNAFPASFRQAFIENYVRRGQSSYFDLWFHRKG